MQPSRGDDSGTGDDIEECAVLEHEEPLPHPVEDQAQ
jgi:hypothetical protein